MNLIKVKASIKGTLQKETLIINSEFVSVITEVGKVYLKTDSINIISGELHSGNITYNDFYTSDVDFFEKFDEA